MYQTKDQSCLQRLLPNQGPMVCLGYLDQSTDCGSSKHKGYHSEKTVATTETVRGSQENSCPSQMSIRKNPSIVQISSGGSTRLSRSLKMNASSHEVYPGASVLRRSTAQTHPGCSVTTTSVIRKHRVRKPTNWVTRVSADLGGHIPV